MTNQHNWKHCIFKRHPLCQLKDECGDSHVCVKRTVVVEGDQLLVFSAYADRSFDCISLLTLLNNSKREQFVWPVTYDAAL